MGSNSVVKATGVILIMNMAVKILGFLRETFLAGAFGASYLSDAYLSAYTIPYFLQAILGFALVTAVVPLLTRHLMNGRHDEACAVGSSVINLSAVLMLIVCVIGVLVADPLVSVLAPGYDTMEHDLTVTLTRIMFPSVIFMAMGQVLTGICNAFHRFAVSAFAPGFSSIIIISSIVIFASSVGVYGVAIGTLVSFIGFFLIQVPVLIKLGFKYSFTLGLNRPEVRRMLKDIIPIVLGVAVNQIYFALNRIFASWLAEGTVSCLNYANKVMQLPMGIFVNAVAYAIYPNLSEMALKKDYHQMSGTLKQGIGMVCLISIPAAVGLMVLSEPIIQILFERGSFDHAATLATAWGLVFFAVGLVPMSVNMILTRAYYALEDVKTPVIIGMASVVLNVVLSVVLFKPMAYGGSGLALANSLSAFAYTLAMYFYLRKRHLSEMQENRLIPALVKMIIAALVMAAAVFGVVFALKAAGFTTATGTGALIQTAGGIIVGVAVYVIMAFVLKVEETQAVLAILKRKLGKA